MNNAPSNQTGTGNTFSQGTQSNPFTADLKGEFTSNFGTNTNAVSQIFKEGGFVSNNRTKYLLIAAGLLVVLAVVFYFYTSESTTDEGEEENVATAEKVEPKPVEKVEPKPAEIAETKPAEVAPPVVEQPVPRIRETVSEPMAGGNISLSSPSDGSSITYDETTGPAQFTWRGGGGRIVFSRSKSMRPVSFKARVRGNSYTFNHPWAGTWYWRVENGGSMSEVRSFTVAPAPRRSIAIAQPAAGGTLAGTGGVVSWQTADRVAFYRVEFSNGSWANPQFRFASSGNSLQIQGVAAGSYQMRVGAFSEVSGRWEYTQPVPVTVQ